MGLNPVNVKTAGGIPVFAQVFEVAQGGFTLDVTGLTAGDVIPAGSPFAADDVTRVAKLSKTAVVLTTSGATDTSYQVVKGHKLAVGEYLAKTVGDKAYAITAIDTSNAAYDSVTVGTTLGTLTANDVLFVSSATGATSAAIKNVPNGLLKNDVKVGSAEGISLVVRGTAYERRLPGLLTSMKTGMSGILFNKSY